MSLTSRVAAWRDAGQREEFRGHGIHAYVRQGSGRPIVLLHGFPSSSYDWRQVLGIETERPALAFDFLGFGLSDKPRDHDYTLAWQADLTEELVQRHLGGEPVYLVAHDMGTSVATELLARELDGVAAIELGAATLFNGSIILERAQPTVGQKLLRSRIGPLASRLASERFFRWQFGSIFSDRHPLSDQEAEDQWSLVSHSGGQRIGHRLVAYMNERVKFASRWHGAIRDWPKPVSFAWGMLDPVATPDVLAGLRELRPSAPVKELPDLGHYPQLEDPDLLTAALLELESGVSSARSPREPTPGRAGSRAGGRPHPG